MNHRVLCLFRTQSSLFRELKGEIRQLKTNDSIIIPFNAKHRLENTEKELLVIYEIQFGELIDEKDISRYEDRYGRC